MDMNFVIVQELLRTRCDYPVITEHIQQALSSFVSKELLNTRPLPEIADIILKNSQYYKILNEVMHIQTSVSTDKEIIEALSMFLEIKGFGSGEVDTITACFYGPIDAGDIPSKVAASYLSDKGYAQRIVVKGDEGYLACTHKGAVAYRVLKALNKNI